MADGVSSGRHISGSTTAVVCRYVERVAGPDGVREMLARAGDGRSLEDITSLSGWSSYAEACALFESARDVTGDPDVGFRIGEEMLRQHSGTEVAALLRALGSPGELLRNVAATGAKYSTVTRLEAVRVGERSATVTGEVLEGFCRHRLLCDYTAGLLSQASALFGMAPALVQETECQVRGAPRCVYEVSWDQAAPTGLEREQHLEAELAALAARFEALQATAAEMVSTTDVETLLGRIAHRAGLAVRAPGHILAVRMPGETKPRVHADGVPAAERGALAEHLLQREVDTADDGLLAVDVVSAHHDYGRLAALYPRGSRFLPHERRVLQAFASQAAAALDTATAMQQLSRRNDTARDLLGLASELGHVASKDDAARRIATAVTSFLDCDAAAVFLWDPHADTLTMRASIGLSEAAAATLGTVALSPEHTPVLRSFLSGGPSFVLDPDHDDPVLHQLLGVSGQVAAALVPIFAAEEFFGVVTAGVATDPSRLKDDDHTMELLTGLAAHAAAALRNARLLDELTYRALHDPLTGLPNRTLLRDRLSHAIEQARRSRGHVGVLAVDLNHFKQINDTYGHSVGDSVIVAQADRLRGALRSSDTVARMGGDEFAVVLPDVADASACEEVARKLLRELELPVVIDGLAFAVSASIGTVCGSGDDTYDDLLKRADVAMYDAKRTGMGGLAVTTPGQLPTAAQV